MMLQSWQRLLCEVLQRCCLPLLRIARVASRLRPRAMILAPGLEAEMSRPAQRAAKKRCRLSSKEPKQATLPVHGAANLPSVEIVSSNLELEDEDGFIGDKASKSAFREA